MEFRPANDLQRAEDAIRAYRLCRPPDPVGQFSYPKNPDARAELADFIYDVVDRYAARAVLDVGRRTITWDPPHGRG